MLTKTRRPKYLNLLKIRQPITAVVSIFHRISGVILFFSIPAMIYLFAVSVRSAEDFASIQNSFSNTTVQLLLVLVGWSIVHHFFAGIRFLLQDFDIGLSLKTARASAWLVLCLVLAVCIGGLIVGLKL